VPNGDKPIIHLVDDDPSYLQATTRMLRHSGYRVENYSSAQEMLSKLPVHGSGCILTDLRMPDMDGLDFQQALLKQGCLLPVIFLTAYGDIPTTVTAMRQGAEDFLTKDASRETLLSAIEQALERNRSARQQQARLMHFKQNLQTLTPRERQILELVVQGKMNKQIAAELGIHERTVKLHRASGIKKLAVSSVPELSILWTQVQSQSPTD